MPPYTGLFRSSASRRPVIQSAKTAFSLSTPERQMTLRVDLPKKPVAVKAKARKVKLTYPSDGLVRATAAEANRDCPLWRSDFIERFDRVSKLYCRLVLGYHDRHVREEWLYLELKRKIQSRKDVKQSVPRQDLPDLVRLIVGEMERDILALVERGRRIKNECTDDRTVVMCTVGRKTSVKCFLIAEGHGPSRIVKSFQTAAQHDRRRRTHLRGAPMYHRPQRRVVH